MTSQPETKATPAGGRLPAELVASNVFLLKRLGHVAKLRALEAYDDVGLGPYHHAILALLDERGAHETQASIADALGYDRGTLVGLLDELEERHLLERKRDPEDRRRHMVTLTADGTRTLERLRDVARQVEEAYLEPLDDGQRDTLHELLLLLAERHEPRFAGRDPR